ncbi:MFS transporter [Saccharothrix coeruleofusca]|nr:MFS transporter [Saccharothrix coeruleofusca]
MSEWKPLVPLCAGAAMLLLDVTVVNVALPSAAAELRAGFTELQWTVDVYVLALAALLLGAGSAADRFGRRRTYVVGLAAFGAASLACGLSPAPGALIAARAVQGVAAACLFATAPALLDQTYRGRARGFAFGVWGGVSAAAAAAGPVVGGVLTHYLGWRWIFLVNVPVSAAALVLALRLFPRSARDPRRRLDLLGTGAFAVSAGALVYLLIRGGAVGWTSTAALVLLAVCLLALVVFALVERRRAFPVLEPALLRRKPFLGASVAAVALTVSAYSYLLYVSLRLQTHDGLSALQTGLVLAPLGVTAMISALLRGRSPDHPPPRVPIALGLLLIAAGALVMLVAGTSWPSVLVGTAVTGTGTGLVSPVLAATAIGAVPGDRAGMASAVNAACRQLGTAVGIALFGAVYARHGLPVLYAISAAVGITGAAVVWPLLRTARPGRPRTHPIHPTGPRAPESRSRP